MVGWNESDGEGAANVEDDRRDVLLDGDVNVEDAEEAGCDGTTTTRGD